MGGQLALKQEATTAVAGNRPQYVRMADTLTERIRSGFYPVDSLLPTEAELCLEFATSRHTVREALRLLTGAGLIARRQGSGSRVLNRSEASAYVHSISSFTDILREVSEARFTANVIESMDTNDFSCPFMNLSSTGRWLRITGVRSDVKTGEPICHSMMFVDESMREAIETAGPGADLCQKMSELLGDDVHEVEQEITVTPVPQEVGTTVGLEPGALTVKFMRRCVDAQGRLLVGSVNFYPIDRFSYRLSLQRGD